MYAFRAYVNDLVPKKLSSRSSFSSAAHPAAIIGLSRAAGWCCSEWHIIYIGVVAELGLGPSSMYCCAFSASLPCLGDCF